MGLYDDLLPKNGQAPAVQAPDLVKSIYSDLIPAEKPTTNPFSQMAKKTASAVKSFFGFGATQPGEQPTPAPMPSPQEANKPPAKANTMVFPIGEGIKPTAVDLAVSKTGQAVKPGFELTPEGQKQVIFESRVKPALERQKSIFDTVKAEQQKDPLSGGAIGVFTQTFLPTRVILNGGSTPTVQGKAKQEIAAQYEQDHPYISLIPQAIGQIANLILFRQAGAGFGLAGKTSEAAGGLKSLYPTLTRALGVGLETGSIFGIENAVDKYVANTQQGLPTTPADVLKAGAKGLASGLALGPAGTFATLPGRVVAGAGSMAGWSALEHYIQDGKIDGKDVADIGLQGLIGGLFELAGGTQKSRLIHDTELANFENEKLIGKLTAKGISRAEAEQAIIVLEQLPNAVFGPEGAVTKSRELKVRIVNVLKELPEGFPTWALERKSSFVDKVSQEVRAGASIEDGITKAKDFFGISAIQPVTPAVQAPTIAETGTGEAVQAVSSVNVPLKVKKPKGAVLTRQEDEQKELKAMHPATQEAFNDARKGDLEKYHALSSKEQKKVFAALEKRGQIRDYQSPLSPKQEERMMAGLVAKPTKTPSKPTKNLTESIKAGRGNVQKKLRKLYEEKKPELEQTLGEVFAEMQIAEAGKRAFGEDGQIISWGSTFPSWVPEDLRSREIFNKALSYLNVQNVQDLADIKYPSKNSARQRALVEAVLNRVDDRLGINTASLRQAIVNSYDRETKRTTKAPARRSARSEGGAGVAVQEKSIAKEKEVARTAGGLASKGSQPVCKFEVIKQEADRRKDFKLHEKVQELVRKYATRIGEKTYTSKAIGLFYPQT